MNTESLDFRRAHNIDKTLKGRGILHTRKDRPTARMRSSFTANKRNSAVCTNSEESGTFCWRGLGERLHQHFRVGFVAVLLPDLPLLKL